MSEWHRFLLGLAAASVYAGLVVSKILDTEKAGISSRKERWRTVRFDVIRRFADGALLTGFLVSPLFPLWFGLFRETALGYCTGCLELIFATLLVSVFIDWFPVRNSYIRAGKELPSFPRFLLRQFVHITRIIFALTLVWCVFLFLEPTKASLPGKLAGAAAVLLLLRLMLRMVRGSGNKAGKAKEE